MATPQQLRRDIATLVDEANGDLDWIWSLGTPEQIVEALRDILPGLIDAYGAAAATVTAEWYDELRESQAVAGRFSAIAADIPETGAQALIGWAIDEATDDATFKTLLAGGMQRRIANFSRQSVMESSLADPQSDGWMRVGNGDNCAFCDLLIGRGAVFSGSTVRFASHDHCNCGAAPSWGRPSDIFDVEQYRRSRRNRSDETRTKDNARARDWIEANL